MVLSRLQQFFSPGPRTGYEIKLEPPAKPITELNFPDITKLSKDDRNYREAKRTNGSNRDEPKLSDTQLEQLQLRSQFYEDLGVESIDEYFLGGEKDRYGERRRSETLAGMGALKVLQAIRTFTTDTSLINYRLDVQDDLEQNPQLIPTFNHFYKEALNAQELHNSAYAKDRDGRRMTDQWGRWIFKNWANLPTSFVTLDNAITELQQALESTQSKGMQEVKQFLDQVKAHPTYQGWTQYAGKVHDGGRYFVAFDYEPADGIKLGIQLGIVPKGSALDDLLNKTAQPDGKLKHPLSDELTVKRVTGLIKNEYGHVIQDLMGLNFDRLDIFCDVLTKGMKEQLSFYAAVGNLYAQYTKLGIPFCRPEFGERDGIQIQQTIHPVVAKNASKDGKNFTLNDYNANTENNGIVVTGPNDGGKTCSGKAFGLSIAMAQAGIRPPAQSMRMQRPIQEIYTHFIIKEEVQEGKGRHKNELLRARKLCEALTPSDFLLYDEPCGGTDVESGLEDSLALLGYAHKINVPFIFATHLHPLSEIIEHGEFLGVRNMQAEIISNGEDDLILTHKIIPGRALQSYGTRISKEVRVDRKSLDTLLQERIQQGQLDVTCLRTKK